MTFLSEEEKLARDIYVQLFAKWKLRAFDAISRGEQRHFESIGTLLSHYGVADPAAGTLPGVFSDPALSALYTSLVEKGTCSPAR